MGRNTKIEETLNLPSMEDLFASDESDEANITTLNTTAAMAEQAGKVLAVQDGDGHAQAMDEIHKDTLKTARDLVDLGFNVDQRSAATIFEKATMMYKAATDAKNSKRDMQLRAQKLMLDQRKLDLEERRLQHEMGDVSIDAESTIVEDRNDLIRRIRAESKKQQET